MSKHVQILSLGKSSSFTCSAYNGVHFILLVSTYDDYYSISIIDITITGDK